jgi:hypothetical protein
MSSKLVRVPFAITSDGRALLNLACFDVPIDARTVLEVGLSEPGRLFLGIELSEPETAAALERLGHGFEEAAAFAAGRRQRRGRSRRPKGP